MHTHTHTCALFSKCSVLKHHVYLQIKQLTEELSAAVDEKERLLSERSDRHDVMEKMNADVTSLTEERDQLHETLQQLERDNIQIKHIWKRKMRR